jgi:hypothetical protein
VQYDRNVFFKDHKDRLYLCAREGYNYLVKNANEKVHLKFVFKCTRYEVGVMIKGVMFSHLLNTTLANKKLA